MATQAVVTINHATGNLDLSANAYAADVGGSDAWANTGNELVYVENGSGSPLTVTENYGPGATADGQTLTNRTHVVAAGKRALLGPFPTALFNDAAGKMNLAWSATTTIKFMPFLRGV